MTADTHARADIHGASPDRPLWSPTDPKTLVPRKIRVLQIVTRLVVRGVPRHVLDLATHLDKDRFEVEVLAGRGESSEGSLWEEAHERGVVTHRVEALQREVNPITDLAAYRAILKKIEAGNFDVVHTHISKAGFLGRLAAKRAEVPLIVHTYHGEVGELRGPGVKCEVLRRCERRAAKISDVLIAISEDVRRNMLAMGFGDQTQHRVIPNGIDMDRFDPHLHFPRPKQLIGRPILGYIGSLTSEKGVDVLLRAMPAVVEHFPDVQLCVVGDGPLGLELREEAVRLGLAERVCFAGATLDVRPWLAAFEMLILPSRSEGMGRVLIEAMAMATAVVAARVGGVAEVVIDGETGLLVQSANSEELARVTIETLAAPVRRRELAASGRRAVAERYSLPTTACEIAACYGELPASPIGVLQSAPE